MESGTPGPPPAPEAPVPPPTGAITQAGQVPQIRAGSGPPSAPYAVITEFDRQEEFVNPVRESADAKEGALAFVEKRTPEWTGS